MKADTGMTRAQLGRGELRGAGKQDARGAGGRWVSAWGAWRTRDPTSTAQQRPHAWRAAAAGVQAGVAAARVARGRAAAAGVQGRAAGALAPLLGEVPPEGVVAGEEDGGLDEGGEAQVDDGHHLRVRRGRHSSRAGSPRAQQEAAPEARTAVAAALAASTRTALALTASQPTRRSTLWAAHNNNNQLPPTTNQTDAPVRW